MIRREDIIADMHTHTIFSGHAYSTVQENIAAAQKAGLRYLAITDHYYGDGTALDRKNEVTRLRFLERDVNFCGGSVYLVGGAEFNLGQSPESWDKLSALSWKVIGLHSFFTDLPALTIGGLYELFEKAAGEYDAFAHIERGLHRLEGYRYGDQLHQDNKDFLEKTVVLAKEHGVWLEVNESSLNRVKSGTAARLRYWLAIARENGNPIYLGSDAHFSGKVGVFEKSLALLNELDYPRELILNCDEEKLHKIIRK